MTRFRPTRAEIAPAAITANVATLAALVAPSAVCAVVKGDGYGHGAVTAARAALAGGATRLAVALVEEALDLRAAAVDAPILVLSEPPLAAWDHIAAADVEATVYSTSAIAAAGDAAAAGRPVGVHLKVDTGMHRVGCDPADAVALARAVVADPGLTLAGVFTHLATADDPASDYADVQLARYRSVLDALERAGIGGFVRHAANSAGALALPEARYDLVRCGIACYGVAPSPALAGRAALTPALRLVTEVSHVQRLSAGEPVSYGCRWTAPTDTTVVTVPIGYADGVPRSLGFWGGQALVGGRRVPVVGTVTMDQLMLDVGELDVRRGDEVVLVGAQGDEHIDAQEVAGRQDTIGYEILTRIGPRVPRVIIDR